jgi:hypothetical protein
MGLIDQRYPSAVHPSHRELKQFPVTCPYEILFDRYLWTSCSFSQSVRPGSRSSGDSLEARFRSWK